MKERLFPTVEQFIQDNQWFIVFLIGISLLSYGYELFNFNISIDAELTGVEPDQWYWISIGRWGMYLINRYLILHTTIPVAPLAIALMGIIFSSLAIFRLFTSNSGVANYIFPALAISFPTLPHVLMFSTSAAGIGIGMLAATIGIYFYLSIIKIHKLYAMVLFTFALAVYQSLVLFIAGILMMLAVHEFILNTTTSHHNSFYVLIKTIANHVAFLLLVGMVYISVSQIFILIRDVKPLYAGFIHLQLLFTDTNVVLKNSAYYVYTAYSGDSKIYTDNLPLMAILNIISFVSIFKLTTQYRIYTVIKLFAIITCLLIPFAFNLLSNGMIAVRVVLALPFVSTIFWWMGYNYGGRLIKQIIVIIGSILIIQFAVINNRNFNSTGIALDHDKVVATNLIFAIDKIVAINANMSSALPCIELVGYKVFPANEFFSKHEVFGASFFEWGKDAPEHVWRMYRFLKLMGLNKELQVCSTEKSRSVMDLVHTMPSWPMEDAIKVVKDILIVKLSN